MGKLGRAIDSLPDDVKDYMVRSQRWLGGSSRADAEMVDPENPDLESARKCVAVQVAAAFGPEVESSGFVSGAGTGRGSGWGYRLKWPSEDARKRCDRVLSESGLLGIGPYYDRLCERFGQDRIVRAIKQRAAATTSSEVESEPRETAVA